MYFPEYPIPACYARIVDEGLRDVQVGIVGEEFEALSVSDKDKNNDIAGSGRPMALEDAVEKNVSLFSFLCFWICFLNERDVFCEFNSNHFCNRDVDLLEFDSAIFSKGCMKSEKDISGLKSYRLCFLLCLLYFYGRIS